MWLTIGIMVGVAGTTAAYTGADPVKSVGSALASGAVVQTMRHPWKAGGLMFPKHGLVRTVGAKVGADLWHVAKAFAGTTTGGVIIGYTAGAAIGTAIVTKEFGWDPEGETMGGIDVLGFYTAGVVGPRPTKDQILTAYEYAPRTQPGKYLQYLPNITWLWGKENIAYI